ncbi:cytochrome P450 6d1-like [Haematobia irritans]|uniref:cytochrome P450 6d1-like n=1 Tax=Haematobia irritans TaxID=7368 RepID=UPI003F50AB4B
MWFLYLIGIFIAAVYKLIQRHYSRWKLYGIPSDEKPSLLYGSLAKVGNRILPFGLALDELYQKFQYKFVGIYLVFKPAILVRDAEMIRDIMTTSFESFHDRGIYVDEDHNPMSANLLSLKGTRWRTLRSKLTPSFSSGKLKAMFDTVDDVAQKLIDHMSQKFLAEGKQLETFEIKSLLTTYTVDIVGSVIFGLDIDSFANPNNEFRLLTSRIFNESTVLQKIQGITAFVCPPVCNILCRLGVRDAITYRLRDIVQQTIEYRERHGVIRKDLLQLFIQLRNTGKISDDSDQLWSAVETAAEDFKSMSIDVIAANAFIFYMAGSETTSATAAYTLYELAMNPDVLGKVQDDVDKAVKKHGLNVKERLTYDAIQDMPYLDLCIMETLRKYPALPFLNRECTQDYQVPESKYFIKKGTAIVVSLFSLHRDPEYFPNPLEYRPERFAKDQMDYNPIAYMPFGQGPRQCIAQRMGMVNVKAVLAKILMNFNIQNMPQKEVEFQFHSAPVLVPKNGLLVTFSKRSHDNVENF